MLARLPARLLVAASAAAVLFATACSTAQSPTSPGVQADEGTPAPSNSGNASATARYRVTFQATWSPSTHPDDFPTRAHFSPLVGGTHNSSVRFWEEGSLATTGIKDMAERGRTTPLDQEVGAAVTAGTAERVLLGGPIDDSPGSVSIEFEISQSYPLVTLVSMIAPSPDWFVGISALALFQDGQWIDSRRIDLVPWDAGTDSGATFMSPDVATTPPVPIARIVNAPLAPAGRVTPLGTFTFTRLVVSP